MGGVDIKLENERQRQSEILRARMSEKKNKSNSLIQANEIIDQANEADLAYNEKSSFSIHFLCVFLVVNVTNKLNARKSRLVYQLHVVNRIAIHRI